MKKNIIIIILAVLVLGLGGYLVYDKLIDKGENQKNEIVDQEEQIQNSTSEQLKYEDNKNNGDNRFETLLYASQDDKYIMTLIDYKDRKLSYSENSKEDTKIFIVSFDNMQTMEEFGGRYYINDNKIILELTVGCSDAYGNIICPLPDGLQVINNFGINQVELDVSDDKIFFGNIKLIRKY